MRNFKIITLLTLTILFSCKKYVDIQSDTRFKKIESLADCQMLLDATPVMNSGSPTDGDLSSDDMYINDLGYLSPSIDANDKNLYIWTSSTLRASATPQWQSSYYTVYYANLVLETVDRLKNKETNQNLINSLRGSSLFFRSYAFWQIAQIYAKPYGSSSTIDPGIPLRLSSDINDKSTRGTVADTYSQIIKDLNEALILLPASTSAPTRPNKTAVYAMLARVYLSMGNYSDALSNANNALTQYSQLVNYNTLDPNSDTPFSPYFNKEIIFYGTATSTPFTDPFGDVAKVDPQLAASYSSNDLRGQILITSDFAGGHRFKGDYSGVDYSSNWFNGLAVDEMYLIRSECYARANKVTEAMTDLNTLLVTRWKTGTYVNMTASNADDALAKILTERRKQLLMRNLRWTDLRRLNMDTRFAKTLSRTVKINNVSTTFTLPPNDVRYTLLIPIEVIQNGGIPQNQR